MFAIPRSLFDQSSLPLVHRVPDAFHFPTHTHTKNRIHVGPMWDGEKRRNVHFKQKEKGEKTVYTQISKHIHIHWVILNPVAVAYALIIQRHSQEPLS